MVLPSITIVGNVVGAATFLSLLTIRVKSQSKRPIGLQDLFAIAAEALMYASFVVSGLEAMYFGLTGSLYPGVQQSEFRPQIFITGLWLISASPILFYRRLLNGRCVRKWCDDYMVTRRRKKVSFWKTVNVPKRVKVTFYVSSKRKKKKTR